MKKYLCCPSCHSDIKIENNKIKCVSCKNIYSIIENIPIMIENHNRYNVKPEDWDQYKDQLVFSVEFAQTRNELIFPANYLQLKSEIAGRLLFLP